MCGIGGEEGHICVGFGVWVIDFMLEMVIEEVAILGGEEGQGFGVGRW